MTSTTNSDTDNTSSRTARSPEELFPLLDYCRAGKLKEVSKWIEEGHPINPPPIAKRSRRRSPLEIAIEKGFFALAELLLDGGAAADGASLECAVQQRRADIAKLLIERGVPADAVWHGVIYNGGPELVRLFIAHGFDPTKDFTYYTALCEHVHPHLSLLKDYKERFPDLQRQAEAALAHYCREGNLRAVSLLCWAGARPDAPVSYRIEDDDPESRTTPLEEAARAGHLPVLKKLKPQSFPDVLVRLMDALSWRPSGEMIEYLLELGAPLNTKPNGGSRLLEDLIRQLDYDSRGMYPSTSSGRAESTLKIIAHIARRGAKWTPDPDEKIRHHRHWVRSIDPAQLVQLFRILKDTGAANVEYMDAILASPALKKRLGPHLKTIEEILRPPAPKPVPVPHAKKAGVPPAPRPPAADLRSRAQEALLDVIRQMLVAHFTEREVRLSIYADRARRRLGLPRGEKEDLAPIFAKAVEVLNARTRAFSLSFDDGGWSSGSKHFSVLLKNDAEWPDLVREAWESVVSANPFLLTDIGLRLYDLIRAGAFASKFAGEQAIAAQVRLGTGWCHLERHLWEIRAKAAVTLCWESTGGERYGAQRSYRIWIDVEQEPDVPRGLNPRFDIKFDQFTKADLDAARQRIHEMVIEASPENDEPLAIIDITTHRQLVACFSEGGGVTGRSLANFFGSLKWNDALVCQYQFGDHADRWFLKLAPVQDWPTSLAAVRGELAQPTPEAKFGISSEAAKLFSWVQSLRAEDMLGCYSPIVENERKRSIGIASPWGDENFPAYLQMLVDEINANTEFDLRLQPWKEYSCARTRLRVAWKACSLSETFKQLQLLAWRSGVTLDRPSTLPILEKIVAGTSYRAPHETLM